MKRNTLSIALMSILLLSGCTKFLDVLPQTQIPADKLFSSEQGFKDALSGVYISAKSNDSYGKALMFETIESLVSSWDVTNNSLEQQLGFFNYADDRVIQKLNSIFSQQYATIAAINSIVQNLEANKSVFTTPGMYELIKAECLGLRAYIHFDLMRLYGPIPSEPTRGNQLAYVTEFSTQINAHISYQAFKDQIFADLQNAAELIKNIDPLLSYSVDELRNPDRRNFVQEDIFFAYRNMRMNYYAMKALEARARLWYGDREQAYIAAKEVVDAKDSNGEAKFKLASGSEYGNGNFILVNEQIFGLYAFDLAVTYTNNFGNSTYRKGTSATLITNDLYGSTGTDIRETSLWNIISLGPGTRYNVIKKFLVSDENILIAVDDYKQMQMIRTSELYLIMAETAPSAEGIGYLNAFRRSRNIAELPSPADAAAFQNELTKEYRKEFYGEGQAFYAYKRLNASRTQVLFAPPTAVVNYVLPMPTVESIN